MSQDIIARRIYQLTGPPSVDFTVEIERPVEISGDYKCSYNIHWPNGTVSGYAMGVDAIQSLILAIRKLGVDLYLSESAKNGQLIWLEAGGGYGILLPKGLEDRYVGDDPP
jgi:hypothetical protein